MTKYKDRQYREALERNLEALDELIDGLDLLLRKISDSRLHGKLSKYLELLKDRRSDSFTQFEKIRRS